MASRLTKMAERVRACLGPVDPVLADAVRVLEAQSPHLLPLVQPERRQVAVTCVRGLEAGWRRGSGAAGLRRALRRFPEFDECRFDVAVELRELHAELVRVVDECPGRWD